MSHRDKIHTLLRQIAMEMLQEIKECEANFDERWVPAADVRRNLELEFVAVPKENKQYGPKGWLFAIIARMLEDDSLIEYKKIGNRAYLRSV